MPKNLHSKLNDLRNELIAHSDIKAYTPTIHIIKLDTNLSLPFKRRIPEYLTHNDIILLKEMTIIFKNQLFLQQNILAKELPMGTYH